MHAIQLRTLVAKFNDKLKHIEHRKLLRSEIHQPLSGFVPIRILKMTGEFAKNMVNHVLLRLMSSAR